MSLSLPGNFLLESQSLHAANAGPRSQNRKPNFVYILCDDLGYGDLGCYGHPIIKTPNLDALARSGMKLTDCYAAAPVCSPSRSGVMTGRTPYRSGILDWIPGNSSVHLKTQEITVAALLKSAGYKTAHCGKWHLSATLDGSQPTPGNHGFDHWFSTQNNASPNHHNPKNFIRNAEPVGPLEGYSSTLIVEEGIRFLRSVKDEPFALFIWFHSPHEPIATAEQFQKMYSTEPDETKSIYYGNVSQMDYEVGHLLEALDDLNLRENTLVMFTSDNGPETLLRYKGARYSHGSPGPLRGMKLHMHEGGIRVPGIIHWPGKTNPGQISREPINGTDVLPTFCEIAGIEAPSDRAIDGASMLPIFSGDPITRKIPLYWRYDKALSEPKIAMRQGEWKLLADNEFTRFELYNLNTDMGETTNLAEKEPQRLETMVATLKALQNNVMRDPISK